MCSNETVNGSVSRIISRLEQRQVAIRPPSYRRPLSRSVSQPASRPQVSTNPPRAVYTTDDARVPAYRLPETEIDRKSGDDGAATSVSERLAPVTTDVIDRDVRITSSLRQRAGKHSEVCLLFSPCLRDKQINTIEGQKMSK